MARTASTIAFCLLAAFTIVLAETKFDPKVLETLAQSMAKGVGVSELYEARNEKSEDVFVTIRHGTLKGYTGVSTNNSRTIYKYKGIPYAQPPVGNLRFQPPQPMSAGWDGVRNATENPPACGQFMTALSPPDEDCLYLNVFTPRSPNETQNPLPVMFFIHGGGFAFGDSVIYGPARLLQEDVVLVTIHYRLGALGFLSTGDGIVPGNNGMKDMVQGLRWVRDNIEAFGGDPNQVTIFGESAGAAASTLLLISPAASGLFHRVIAQSGTALAPWALDAHPWASAQKYGARLNCSTTTSTALVTCLRSKPWRELAEASFMLFLTNIANLHLNFDASTAVIEPNLPGAFLTQDPFVIMKNGTVPDVPVMLGAVQHEASLLLGAAYMLNWEPAGVIDDPYFVREEMLPTLVKALGPNEVETGGAPITSAVALAYLPSPMPENFTETIPGLVDFLSVSLFKAPIQRTADLLSRRLSNVYLYSMEYYGFNTLWTLVFDVLPALVGLEPPPIKHGMMHADDLQYLFTMPFIIAGNDRRFSDKLVKIWTDMAKGGNPTPNPSAEIPTWPRYQVTNPQYYRLALQNSVEFNYAASWRKGYTDMKA